MSKQRFNIRVRRGLWWVSQTAGADYQAAEPDDFTAEERKDIEAALQWLSENKSSERQPQITGNPCA